MSNLTAEKRYDKHGKLVTRHVKTTTTGISDAAIPAPSLNSGERTRALKSLAESLVEWYEPRDTPVADIIARMDSWSEDTVKYVADATGMGDDQTHPSETAFLVGGDFKESTVREYIAFGMAAVDCEDMMGTVDYVQSLHRYDRLKGYEDLSRAPQEVQTACFTMVKLAFELSPFNYDHPGIVNFHDETDGRYYPMLKNKQLVNLILDHPDRGDDIREFIEERGYKVKAVAEMVATAPRALQSGWL